MKTRSRQFWTTSYTMIWMGEKTGKIPMQVNTMLEIIVYESKDERGEMPGDVNALQARDSCLFCKKASHQK